MQNLCYLAAQQRNDFTNMFYILGFNVFVLCFFARITSLDMATAVQHLREPDHDLQVLGAAYIQHECYNDSEAKQEVLKTILTCGSNSSRSLVSAIRTETLRYIIGVMMDDLVTGGRDSFASVFF